MNIAWLKQISETPGVSGFETPIRDLLKKKLTGYADSSTTDKLGNLIFFRKGKKNLRLMVAAHMDEIGFIVRHIDEQGFVRFLPLGGFDPKTLTAQRVVIHGKKDITGVMGSKPVHLMKADEKNKPVEMDSFFIDTGLSKKEVEKWAEVGNPISRKQELIEMGECVNGKSLDNRISVFMLAEVLRLLYKKPLPFDLHVVFTVQEEVGLRGAQVATMGIKPDFAIALDTTIAWDTPGAGSHESVSKLGNGIGIKIMDGSVISDQRMVEYMKQIARKNKVKWQSEMLPAGGTDTGYMQRMTAFGSVAGAISVPTRHIHQVVESCNKKDVEAGIKLLTECILQMDTYSWKIG